MLPKSLDSEQTAALLAVARGDMAADLVIRGGRVVNVYSEETIVCDVVIKDGRIAYVGDDLPDVIDDSTEVIEAERSYVLPGYIEPHCHPWALYNPDTLARAVLPLGHTALVAELLNVQLILDPDDVREVYRQLQQTPMRWYWAARVTGQSAQPLDGPFSMESLESLLTEPGIVQIAEITSWPRVLRGDPQLLDRLALASRYGLRLDGHTAGATAPKVAMLAAAGFTADHEPITRDEAQERLRNGYHVFLRHSSLRPDMDELLPLILHGAGSARLSLTSDGSGPQWIQRHGMIDGLVRRIIHAGVPMERAVAMATLNPATYFRLDEHIGGLAPRRAADLQILADFNGQPPETVIVDGRVVARDGELTASWPEWNWRQYLNVPHGVDLVAVANPASYRSPTPPGSRVPAMQFVSAGIARATTVEAGDDGWPPGAVLCVLFSRDGRRRSWAWLVGFAAELDGLASSYTTSGDFLVIGRSAEDMALAAKVAFNGRGAIVVVEKGEVVAEVVLEVGNSMSSDPLDAVAEQWGAVDAVVRDAGYAFDELLFCLCFITCDFLPDLRLLPAGLLEVKTGRILVPGVCT